MTTYFLLTPANEGVHVTQLNELQLQKQLNEELAEGTERNFLDAAQWQKQYELDFDRKEAVIIKGEVIIPKRENKT